MIGYYTALIIAVITFVMALLQLSLTLGAPFGEFVLGGLHKVLPPKMRITSSTFSIIFIFIGLTYLQKGNIISLGLNQILVNIVVIINTLFLAYAIIGNGFLTKSKKEKYVMTPFAIIQFILSVIVLLFA
jgi:hypothetical protein